MLDGEVDTVDGIHVRPIRDRVMQRYSSGAVEMAFRSAARFGTKLVTRDTHTGQPDSAISSTARPLPCGYAATPRFS